METKLHIKSLVLVATVVLFSASTFQAFGQEACPANGTSDQRTSFLKASMTALQVKSDASKKKQEEWLTQTRAELKLAGKWSAKIGKAWSKEVESDTAFQAHQTNIERLLKDSDTYLLAALGDPELPCSKIELFLSTFAEVQAETGRQFEIMNNAMQARRNLPTADR